MIHISIRTAALSVAAGALLVLASGHTAFSQPASAAWITSTENLFTGAHAEGRIDDIIMENGRVAVVISALDHLVINGRSGGNIVDAGSATARVDALVQVYTHFNSEWPRQAVYESLSILDDGSGGTAVVRATGVDSEDTTLIVVTDYTLEPGTDYMEISTKVVNTGENLLPSFELGDALAFGDCDKFIPGYGYGTLGPTSSSWLAATDGKISYGYSSRDTSTIWGGQGEAWSHMNIQVVDLAPGDSSSCLRYFFIGGRDIASVANVIHGLHATTVGTLHCSVTAQSTGEPVPAAGIEAIDADGLPYLDMLTGEDGLADATLPVGTWRLVATAKRLLPDEQSLGIVAGQVLDRHFALKRDPSIPPTGDTLTIIQRPLLNIPSFVFPGDTLKIECSADPSTTGWTAELLRRQAEVWLPLVSSTYDASTLWWTLEAEVPADAEPCLYDLVVTYDGGMEDTTRHAVSVIPAFKEDYYFVHVTDTHLPTHEFSSNGWISPDTSEMVDFREVIDDINLINPEFVIHTGDLVNEGELEDYL
ncbi:MAG: metallophosphoesterase, partial [bacterium]